MVESSSHLKKLSRLTAWQWQVMMAAPFILSLTWTRLRSAGYKQTLRKAQTFKESRLSAAEQLKLATDTAYALAVAVKYGPWKPLCLLRSLSLAWFLGRKGIAYDLKIGVPARDVFDFTAHAWVEHAGVVLNDKEDITGDYNAFS